MFIEPGARKTLKLQRSETYEDEVSTPTCRGSDGVGLVGRIEFASTVTRSLPRHVGVLTPLLSFLKSFQHHGL